MRIPILLTLLAGCTETDPGVDGLLRWPMGGDDTVDWVINNYVDLDSTTAVLDYQGGRKTYDGHKGIDIDVPSFRAMDEDVPVLAAGPGVVLGTGDSQPDRNMISCGTDTDGDGISDVSATWNFVKVEHDNGLHAWYGHLKQGSVLVAVGDRVSTGQELGVVGSSGCSSQPHLHFELLDPATSTTIEPFQDGLWADPPDYDTPPNIMELSLQLRTMDERADAIDPLPDVSVIGAAQNLGLGLSLAGGDVGEAFWVDYRAPDGTSGELTTIDISWANTHLFTFDNATLDQVGTWEISAGHTGSTRFIMDVEVTEADVGLEQYTRYLIPHDDYQRVFEDAVTAGYRPIYFDGFAAGSSTYANALFVPDDGTVGWTAYHNLTDSEWQDAVDAAISDGLTAIHVDSYLLNGAARYAGIFTTEASDGWSIYHGLSAAAHQTQFDTLSASGYHPVNISVETIGGEARFTALYHYGSVGAWATWSGMTSSVYQEQFDTYADQGLYPAYIHGRTDTDGTPLLTAIWREPSGSWSARHDMTAGDLESTLQGSSGHPITLAGYASGQTPMFAATWE